ncbi:hypothetical protein G3I59_04720 [Amycolatopsis rubida]|uniref:Cell division protein FtsL n=1 Tax=Amycolatopsis rubida TaxID=112413 RepID=A0A1I5L325_9PSEU|nr:MULTISPECIES: hypothetical protein [Amycolatopsis]MYW89941.1 hypothetical protein [Amycolatopsis rubida]NEC54918.1 hypothetical protein [Amycolatopsis rubida]OAP25199.1 Cell division protein FtsL [Amycolatopsis sp. M39]SFO91141.1 hypothetical protein SAMN05421854_103410 [Amycolatopsis rubida]
MTAPTKSRRSSSTAAERAPRNTVTEADAPARRRTTAAERAYARRAQRADLLRQRAPKKPVAEPETVETKTVRTRLKLRWPQSRASFVLVMMGLLAVGVAATLWFTTQAIADSYRLEKLRTDSASLMETKDRLEREVAKAQSPASLAPAAKQLGMVPGGDPARIVVGKDGKTTVVGEPKKAEAPQDDAAAPPSTPVAPPAEGGIEGDLPGTTPGLAGGGQ